MLTEHLLILNRNLPFGMLTTHLLKLHNIDLSGEKVIASSVDINSTLLKRMHVGEHAPFLLSLLLFHRLHLDPPLLLQILLLHSLHNFKILL